jgi:hypothetical protein
MICLFLCHFILSRRFSFRENLNNIQIPNLASESKKTM